MDIGHPFRTDAGGRIARATGDDHVRDLVEQVLFTTPGERVNRPDFGSGLMQLVFAPANDELATTVEFLIQGALQQFLGELLQVETVAVQAEDGTLEVTVAYRLRGTGERRTETFVRQAG
jgi:phage baseplate assembly protein W